LAQVDWLQHSFVCLLLKCLLAAAFWNVEVGFRIAVRCFC
jgi:hypothetical protein